MHVGPLMVDSEGQISYLVALRQEHPLVERLHLVQRIIVHRFGGEDGKVVLKGDRFCIFMEEAAVGLEVDDASGLEELAVTFKEQGAGQPCEDRHLLPCMSLRSPRP